MAHKAIESIDHRYKDGRKNAYKILKENDYVVPDDWWAQRARDHGSMVLNDTPEG